MSYFQSSGRRYQVCVRLHRDDQSHTDVEVTMFSNSALTDVRDIVEDFTDKLDDGPTRYGLTAAGTDWHTFNIINMRDNQKRLWIQDATVYGGLRLEAE